MRCKFCRYGNNNHSATCPRDTPGADERYNKGYSDGRAGRECASEDLAYVAGWLSGDIALDEYQNGCDWSSYFE